MAYRKEIARARRDLDHCVALAVEINRLAEECWQETRHMKLEAIAKDSKDIQEGIARIHINLFGQDTLFGNGDEEPNRSHGPGQRGE